MWWRILQGAVFFGVLASEWTWHWGAGGSDLAVSVVAAFAAWFVTALISAIHDLAKSLISKLDGPAQQAGERWIGGWERLGAGQPERRPHRDHSIKITDRLRR